MLLLKLFPMKPRSIPIIVPIKTIPVPFEFVIRRSLMVTEQSNRNAKPVKDIDYFQRFTAKIKIEIHAGC